MILRPMLSALLLTLLLPAQDPNLKLAQRLITALVPARDSADAQTRSLIEAALDGKNSPAAALLAAEVRSRAEEVTDAPLLRQQLAEGIARAKPVGLVAQRLAEFDFRLWRRTGGVAPADPFASYARSVTILGPFGSGDGPWLDEPFPPDNGFASGSNLRGRYGPVVLRTLTRGSERHTLSLLDPVRQQPGAHFVRWQIAVQVETTGFIEVEYAGSYRLLFDGYEQGRVDPQQQPGSAVKRFCVHLLSGEHAVVLRTGDKSQAAPAGREARRKSTGRFLIAAGLLKIGFQPEPEERPGHRAMWCDAGDGAAAGGSLAGELRAVPHQFLAGTRCPSERTSRRSGCRPGLFPP